MKKIDSKYVLLPENWNKGVTVTSTGRVTRDPKVVLNDPNVQRILKFIRDNNK